MTILIRNGRVIDPASQTDDIMDVLVEGSNITKLGKNISARKADVIDATGLVVAPGFIDMHTHLREPGGEHKETIETGSRSGVKGGYCALVPMANTNPVGDSVKAIGRMMKKARKTAWTHIYPVAAVTIGQKGERLTEIGDLKKAGVVALSDDGHPVTDSEVLSIALECANVYDLPIISHCEDLEASAGGCMNDGPTAAELGLPGISCASEAIMVARDIMLAKKTRGRLHIAHVSCARSVDLIRAAKCDGVDVTCETAPHYFSLTDEAVKKYGTNAKMNPPLRSAKDVEVIKEGLRDGVIDVIATDHAPHAPEEKNAAFTDAPFGIIGLETCLSLVITRLVDEGILSLSDAISRLTYAPACMLGLPMGKIEVGGRADITVFDLSHEFTVDARAFASKSRNSPFDGWRLKGCALYVIVAGRLRLYDGHLVE